MSGSERLSRRDFLIKSGLAAAGGAGIILGSNWQGIEAALESFTNDLKSPELEEGLTWFQGPSGSWYGTTVESLNSKPSKALINYLESPEIKESLVGFQIYTDGPGYGEVKPGDLNYKAWKDLKSVWVARHIVTDSETDERYDVLLFKYRFHNWNPYPPFPITPWLPPGQTLDLFFSEENLKTPAEFRFQIPYDGRLPHSTIFTYAPPPVFSRQANGAIEGYPPPQISSSVTWQEGLILVVTPDGGMMIPVPYQLLQERAWGLTPATGEGNKLDGEFGREKKPDLKLDFSSPTLGIQQTFLPRHGR